MSVTGRDVSLWICSLETCYFACKEVYRTPQMCFKHLTADRIPQEPPALCSSETGSGACAGAELHMAKATARQQGQGGRDKDSPGSHHGHEASHSPECQRQAHLKGLNLRGEVRCCSHGFALPLSAYTETFSKPSSPQRLCFTAEALSHSSQNISPYFF